MGRIYIVSLLHVCNIYYRDMYVDAICVDELCVLVLCVEKYAHIFWFSKDAL